MDRTLAALVVGLLVVAVPVAAALPGAAPAAGVDGAVDRPPDAVATTDRLASVTAARPPATDSASVATGDRALEGTPDRLSVGSGTVTAGFDAPEGDLGAAVGMADGELDARFDAYAARRRVENVTTAEAKLRAIRTALDGVERQVDRLRARERAAIRSYHNGSTDRRELLRTIGRIYAEAGTLRGALDDLQAAGGDLIDYPLSLRVSNIGRDLATFRTPVRERIAAGLRGAGSPGRVHVAATRDGVVLETIDDGWYYRDAVRLDNFDPDAADRYDGATGQVTDRIQELYPWAFANQNGFSIDLTASQLYVTSIPHPQGTTLVYLDGGTGEVYREVQRLRLARIPTETVGSVNRRGVVVRINDTPGHNPLRVSVVNAGTGEPIDAAVRVDDQRVGRTGDDGLWLLGTRGSYNVSVVTEDQTVTVTLSD